MVNADQPKFRSSFERIDDALKETPEFRINLLGWLGMQVVHMTYTERGDDCHVISLRKATKHEARDYFSKLQR